jgi:hypothetical protein
MRSSPPMPKIWPRARRTGCRRDARPAAARCEAARGVAAALERCCGAARSGRPVIDRTDAAQRPRPEPRARAAGRRRHHLRKPAERDRRCGRAALMSGNAVILRGGSEARASNRAIHAACSPGLARRACPRMRSSSSRRRIAPRSARCCAAQGLIDIIVPRGGKSLVARVQDEARVPVLAHLDGINHLYIDRAADPAKARRAGRSTPRCAAPASAARPRRC